MYHGHPPIIYIYINIHIYVYPLSFRLDNETPTKVVKRKHPLEPVIHLVDDKGAGGKGLSMGRTASVATAAALRGLGPSKKADEMAQKMLSMFRNPKEHADYLTSPRCVYMCARARVCVCVCTSQTIEEAEKPGFFRVVANVQG